MSGKQPVIPGHILDITGRNPDITGRIPDNAGCIPDMAGCIPDIKFLLLVVFQTSHINVWNMASFSWPCPAYQSGHVPDIHPPTQAYTAESVPDIKSNYISS